MKKELELQLKIQDKFVEGVKHLISISNGKNQVELLKSIELWVHGHNLISEFLVDNNKNSKETKQILEQLKKLEGNYMTNEFLKTFELAIQLKDYRKLRLN